MCEKKKFTMIDENFICEVCGNEVIKLNYTARDHCNHCLCSKHLDINPGDRQSLCKGILEPVSIEKGNKDKYKIVYKCKTCEMIKRNVMADDDNFEKMLEIMKNNSI
ncbi:MAG: RNHCP domain-containing protein [Bacilli bacterium]|nr:RNHCP domain-containing protein [Bacilli bacterium]